MPIVPFLLMSYSEVDFLNFPLFSKKEYNMQKLKTYSLLFALILIVLTTFVTVFTNHTV